MDWVKLKDRYLTWKTGISKEDRIFNDWVANNINKYAHTINEYFYNYTYIIQVDHRKFFNKPYTVVNSAKQYFYPAAEIENAAMWTGSRVWQRITAVWEIQELGGIDSVFVATNDSKVAMMIRLTYG